MTYFKLNGVIKEIIKRYPNIDIADFLQEKLQIPDYKADELASRIEKECCQKVNKSGQYFVGQLLEKSDESERLKTSVYSVESLSEREFERFAKWLLEELGYEILPGSYSINSGVCLVATKDDKKIAILTKKTQRNSDVSNIVVLKSQELKGIYGCSRSNVLTTSYFTKQAKADAQKFDVELWDRDTLDTKITEVVKKIEHGRADLFSPVQRITSAEPS